jgi:predicted ester cyclase
MNPLGRGHHNGNFFGMAPTGKEIVFREVNMSRVRDGRMLEHCAERSTLDVMQQLGMNPANA